MQMNHDLFMMDISELQWVENVNKNIFNFL